MQSYDIAVVGGSLAGASAAFQLARAGYRTILIDKVKFPRMKACGEGLSVAGIELLRQSGLWDRIASTLPHRPFYGFRIFKGFDLVLSETHEREALGIGVQRHHLDTALVNEVAQHPNITAKFASRVLRIDPERGTVETECERITARLVVLAVGGHSRLAHDLPLTRDLRRTRPGMTFHLTLDRPLDESTVQLFLHPQGELYCTPLSGNVLNVSCIGFAEATRPRSLVELDLIPRLLHCLHRTATSISSPLGVPVTSRGPVASTFGRTLLIGDAAELLDPIGGMGMTHALLSATAAVESVLPMLCGVHSLSQALANYERKREVAARPLRAFTAITYHSLVSCGGMTIAPRPVRTAMTRFISRAVHRNDHSVSHSILSSLGACV